MTFELIHGDARRVSEHLAPASVDLIVTSPPYFALRSYRDECDDCDGDGKARPGVVGRQAPTIQNNNGKGKSTLNVAVGDPNSYAERLTATADDPNACPSCAGTGRAHYDGQIGSEPTPSEFLDALIACTADWLTVIRPGGSIFVNLGDKYSGSGGHNNETLSGPSSKSTLTGSKANRTGTNGATRRNAPDRYNQSTDVPRKSLMGLPWRYANRCVDELGLILRAEIIWSKPNGLPESVTDRVRRSHEQIFHFTREERYFAALDEVREPQLFTGGEGSRYQERKSGNGLTHREYTSNKGDYNPLGKVPGSVWTLPSEPLNVPDSLGVDHFAAFPSEIPRRIILGWSPTGWCTACEQPRRAVVEKQRVGGRIRTDIGSQQRANGLEPWGFNRPGALGRYDTEAAIRGYACACPDTSAPTRPAVVLDPFGGTGTTAAVAHLLGRHGINVDLSRDYLRLAEWRCTSDRRLRDKVLDRSGIPNPAPPAIDGQLDMFKEGAA